MIVLSLSLSLSLSLCVCVCVCLIDAFEYYGAGSSFHGVQAARSGKVGRFLQWALSSWGHAATGKGQSREGVCASGARQNAREDAK